MQYMGGKERIQRHIVDLIRYLQWESGATSYLEPFVGGASIASRASALFDTVVLADAEPLVVDLWNAARAGWSPKAITPEQYADLRDLIDAGPMCGYAAFGVSFGGKRWGGFAKDRDDRKYSQQAAAAGIARKAAGLPVDLIRADYADHRPGDDWIVYCDPPYAGTTGYGGDWDAEKFWRTMDDWTDNGAAVLVSEYAAPPHWVCVWERRQHVALSQYTQFTTERLFTR